MAASLPLGYLPEMTISNEQTMRPVFRAAVVLLALMSFFFTIVEIVDRDFGEAIISAAILVYWAVFLWKYRSPKKNPAC